MCLSKDAGPSGAMAAQPTCNRQVSGFESPLGLYLQALNTTKKGIYIGPNPLACIFTCDKLYPPLFFGGVGEWFKPPDCKSGARKGFAGSNPAPSTISAYSNILTKLTAHIAQTVEHALGKGEVDGSSPSVGSSKTHGTLI